MICGSGETFIVTNVLTKDTMFAHSLDSLPVWSVGGGKNKLLALVLHQTSKTPVEDGEESLAPKSSCSTYSIWFFKCDGDAKGVAEALHKACMNTRKAIRNSATSTPNNQTNKDRKERRQIDKLNRQSMPEQGPSG